MHSTKTEAEQILSADLEYVDMVGARIRQIAQNMQGQDGKQQPQYLGMLQHIDRLETLAGMLTETVDRLRAEARAVAEEA